LLWFSVGAEFFPLRLCHDERRVLGMRRKARKLHRRQGGRGKQHDTKSGHVMLVPRKQRMPKSAAINKRSTNTG
jgi:hypothetical protein